ncbi:hypothetical protein UFOVP383_91 [uncultured Caudovirales phage]|uniref:Uncharacterized protein n=1 Tax=uncultured Caudovirales phage TaxID=2100421 RepID=A0A6J7X877_9CAUD|nr:hypothetical protein UFOVP383_91 [uncultured Caudovirales phage]
MARYRITKHPSSLYHEMAYTVERRVFFVWRGVSTFVSFLEAENFIYWYESIGCASSKTTVLKEYDL